MKLTLVEYSRVLISAIDQESIEAENLGSTEAQPLHVNVINFVFIFSFIKKFSTFQTKITLNLIKLKPHTNQNYQIYFYFFL